MSAPGTPGPPPTESKPPQTAEHWRRIHRGLRTGVVLTAGFLLGAVVALAVVLIDPTGDDPPDRPDTVTVTETEVRTQTTTTEATPSVPDVTGEQPAAARDTLEAAGYAVAVQENSVLCALQADLCEVVGQDPAAGTEAPRGTEVVISIDTT